MAQVHDPMPVILPEDRYDAWLRPETWSGDPREELLVPYPDPEEAFEAYPVIRRVKRPRLRGTRAGGIQGGGQRRFSVT